MNLPKALTAAASDETLRPKGAAPSSRRVRFSPSGGAGHRVIADRPTIDHRERLWDHARKIAPHHLRFFFKKPKAIWTRSCAQRLDGTRRAKGVYSPPHHVCY
jgi:hypothetical protein